MDGLVDQVLESRRPANSMPDEINDEVQADPTDQLCEPDGLAQQTTHTHCDCCKPLGKNQFKFTILSDDLRKAAEGSRCHTCLVLFKVVVAFTSPDTSGRAVTVEAYAKTVSMRISGPTPDNRDIIAHVKLNTLGEYPKPWDSFAADPPSIQRNLMPEESIQTIREWIKSCELHDDCNRIWKKTSPRRLLQIDGPSHELNITLRNTRATEVPYAALSHCWGTGQPTQTLKDNLHQHERGIRWEALPKTFQNAIYLCSRLGIYALWIDSLCIVQDDLDEWADESTRMSSIYENSVLVIAATRANNGSEGLFTEGLQLPCMTVSTGLSEASGPCEILCQLLPANDIHETFTDDVTAAPSFPAHTSHPLLSRAWAFQERLFARRIVHFSDMELFWECREGLDCQCGQAKSLDATFKAWFDGCGTWMFTETDDVLFAWRQLVERYSSKKLTYSTDRLVALAATARHFSELHGSSLGSYLAGHWQIDFIQSLLWRIHLETRPLPRPPGYSAPTWSWASVQSGVQPFGGVEESHGSELISIYCDCVDELGFGSLRSAHIHLRGPLFTTICSRQNEEPENDSSQDSQQLDGEISDYDSYEHDGGYTICGDTFVVDVLPTKSLHGREVQCLVIDKREGLGTSMAPQKALYLCVVLQRTGAKEDMIFTRLGRVNIPVDVVTQEVTMEMVTII